MLDDRLDRQLQSWHNIHFKGFQWDQCQYRECSGNNISGRYLDIYLLLLPWTKQKGNFISWPVAFFYIGAANCLDGSANFNPPHPEIVKFSTFGVRVSGSPTACNGSEQALSCIGGNTTYSFSSLSTYERHIICNAHSSRHCCPFPRL